MESEISTWVVAWFKQLKMWSPYFSVNKANSGFRAIAMLFVLVCEIFRFKIFFGRICPRQMESVAIVQYCEK